MKMPKLTRRGEIRRNTVIALVLLIAMWAAGGSRAFPLYFTRLEFRRAERAELLSGRSVIERIEKTENRTQQRTEYTVHANYAGEKLTGVVLWKFGICRGCVIEWENEKGEAT